MLFVDGAKFLLNEMPVGFFKDGAYPRAPGRYAYEPYRGPGHYKMATLLGGGSVVRCYYDQGEQRISFTVRTLVAYGMIEADTFECRDRSH